MNSKQNIGQLRPSDDFKGSEKSSLGGIFSTRNEAWKADDLLRLTDEFVALEWWISCLGVMFLRDSQK